MNTVADDTLYRIKQDVRTRYGMKSYSTEDDNTKRQMLDDLEFLINEHKNFVDNLKHDLQLSKEENDTLNDTIDDLESDIEAKDKIVERLIKYISNHIVNMPEWVEEIADEYGIELE